MKPSARNRVPVKAVRISKDEAIAHVELGATGPRIVPSITVEASDVMLAIGE
jgi:ABC-type molybdate transport system ATPase subunit